MKRLLIFILAISFSEISIAQNSQYRDSIDLKINIVGNYGDFLVDLKRSDQAIRIKIQVKDSVAERKLAADPKYRRLIRLAKSGRIVMNKTNGEAFVAGHKKYAVYSSDSISVKVDSVIQFDKLLSRIASSKSDELIKTPRGTYIDGFELQLFIKSFGVSRELSLHSPNEKSSPKIKELLHHLVLLSKSTKLHLLKRTVISRY